MTEPQESTIPQEPDPVQEDDQAVVLREEHGALIPFTGATQALAAQVMAMVQARYLVAERHPRDMMVVRLALLEECADADFAAAARYRVPRGDSQITGLSIRFAEAAVSKMGNILVQDIVTFEDGERRIVKVSVTDLERNAYYDHDVTIKKTIERRNPKKGERVISSRVNSRGITVHLVEATDDELETKQAAMISKAIRTLQLRLVPHSLKKECEAAVIATLNAQARKAPIQVMEKVLAGFADLGVTASMLAEYLGHRIAEISSKEVVELRAVYQTLHDKEATWAEMMAGKHGEPVEPVEEKSSKAEEIKQRVRNNQPEE